MRARIKQYWFNVRNSLWFLPSFMALSSVILAYGLIKIDGIINYEDMPLHWFIYSGQREGARAVLSTIASSMVTIAGVTFSITLVALTMASSQFGPRLLRNFISDKGNQFVIGTFISTFIYSLIVLLTIRGTEDEEFLPKISVIFAFLLAVFSLGVIIYFIHHVTTSIQADYLIKSSYNEFINTINKFLLPGDQSTPTTTVGELEKNFESQFEHASTVYYAESGFVQSIDYEGMCAMCEENGIAVQLFVHPGSFATVNQPYARVFHNGASPDAGESLGSFIVTGFHRTPNQDIVFPLQQIVEIGARALSPGINDPHTAVTCVQWLGSALSEISTRKFMPVFEKDSAGVVRVIKNQITYAQIVDACFDYLRLYAKHNVYVTAEILEVLKKITSASENKELNAVIKEKADVLYREQEFCNASDAALLEKTYGEMQRIFSKRV